MITIRVSAAPFDIGREILALGGDGIGAVASFVGIVRGDNDLIALTLEHYPAMTKRNSVGDLAMLCFTIALGVSLRAIRLSSLPAPALIAEMLWRHVLF